MSDHLFGKKAGPFVWFSQVRGHGGMTSIKGIRAGPCTLLSKVAGCVVIKGQSFGMLAVSDRTAMKPIAIGWYRHMPDRPLEGQAELQVDIFGRLEPWSCSAAAKQRITTDQPSAEMGYNRSGAKVRRDIPNIAFGSQVRQRIALFVEAEKPTRHGNAIGMVREKSNLRGKALRQIQVIGIAATDQRMSRRLEARVQGSRNALAGAG